MLLYWQNIEFWVNSEQKLANMVCIPRCRKGYLYFLLRIPWGSLHWARSLPCKHLFWYIYIHTYIHTQLQYSDLFKTIYFERLDISFCSTKSLTLTKSLLTHTHSHITHTHHTHTGIPCLWQVIVSWLRLKTRRPLCPNSSKPAMQNSVVLQCHYSFSLKKAAKYLRSDGFLGSSSAEHQLSLWSVWSLSLIIGTLSLGWPILYLWPLLSNMSTKENILLHSGIHFVEGNVKIVT